MARVVIKRRVAHVSSALPSTAIWREYRKRPTIRARNLILEAYLPLLRTIAASVKKGLPSHIELEDLVSAGCFGLIDAINSFDPERGVSFATFCSLRVRGAIIDGLRSFDLPTRQIREHEAAVEAVCDSFRKQFGRPPCDEEILTNLRVEGSKARRMLRDSRVAKVARMGDTRKGDRPSRLEDSIADRKRPGVVTRAALKDMREFALRRLSRTEQLVLILYHSERMTMREIGIALGYSEARISQIHSIVLAKLQDRARTSGRPA